MYLKKVYRHNKFLFLFCILFVAGQLFINYKRGLVFSPFFHYGMFSEVIRVKNQYTVSEVSVNGKLLAAKDYSPAVWDDIMQPVELFYHQQMSSNQWQVDIHRLLPFADSLKFVNSLSESDFKKWYRLHLQPVLKQPVDSVQIAFTDYYFNGKSLTKANK